MNRPRTVLRTERPLTSARGVAAASMLAAVLAAALLAAAAPAAAQSLPSWLIAGLGPDHTWPMLGADAGRGAYTSLSGPEDASILPPWPFAAGGAIASSAVVDHRQWIYFGADDGYLYALRPAGASAAGLLAWRFESDSPIVGSPGLSRDPDGQTLIYAADAGGIVYALRADGTVRWQLELGAPVVSSLAVVGRGVDTWLYLKAGKDLVAVRDDVSANTGSVVWQQSMSTAGAGLDNSPAVSLDGSWVAATDLDGELYVFDGVGGSLRCSAAGFTGTPTSPVIDADGAIYFGLDDSGQGSVESWELAGFGCRQRWSKTVGGPVAVAPTLAPHGLLVAQTGDDLVGLDRANGSAVWTEAAPWSGVSPAVADGADRLYVPGADRRIHAFRLTAAGPVLAWELITDQTGQMAAPAIDAVGRLVVPSLDEHVYVLQSLPAFMVAFGSDLALTPDLELHTLREIYGEIDPIANPWARIARLIQRPGDDTQPSYAVDGRLLAWSSRGPGPADILLAASGGGEAVPVTDDDGSGVFPATSWETDPAFSPMHPSLGSRLRDNGFYLAMTLDNGDGKDLRFLDLERLAQGRRVEDLKAWLGRLLSRPAGDPVLDQLVPSGEQRSQPAFAPDGSALAYSACQRSGGVSTIYVVIQDLWQASRQLLFTAQVGPDCPEALERGFAPTYSPDGDHLAYHLFNGGIRIHTGSGVSIVLPDAAGAKPIHPSWSPDGTEILAGGDFGFSGRPQTLYVYQGPHYQSAAALTAPLGTAMRTFEAAEHHPARFPEPLLDVDCTAPGAAPPLVVPASARPGEVVEVYGCGFDIKVPERQQVEFVHALDTSRFVAGDIQRARVDVGTGLGVLEVEVPYLAGNGPVGIATAFGRGETGADPDDCRDADPSNDDGCFVVEPLTVALWQPQTVHGAKIRVAGYGLQVMPGASSPDPRLDRVLFTGPSGTATVPADVEAVRLEPCGPSTPTPCPPNAPVDVDGLPRVAWLEVTVPPQALPGPVTVVGPGAAAGHSCCSLGFLAPGVTVTPDKGSEGSGGGPGAQGGPTFFRLRGDGFPFDPYFDYVEADLAQISPDRQTGAPLAQAVLGRVELTPVSAGSHVAGFETDDLFVRPDATARGGELHMEAVGVGSGARAFARFRTPLRGLPIIFVPGTSGTFLSNTGSSDLSAPCNMTYPAGGDIWMSEGTVLKIARPVVGGSSLPVPFAGCQDYLYDALALERGSDLPLHSNLAEIRPSRVIDSVLLPTLRVLPGVDDKHVYRDLIDFLRGPAGLGRVAGSPLTGACGSTAGNCFYLFPMDWRKDYASQAAALGSLVRSVKSATGQDRVVLMGHSMGGPVIDYYLRTDFFAEQDVDQVVTFGGGHLGVGLPYEVLQRGHDWELNRTIFQDAGATGLEVVDPETIQRLAIDWPTAYWQLPSEAWFDDPNSGCNGDCWLVWEDEWDVDGDGFCGSDANGTRRPCSGPAARNGGKHRNGSRHLDFMRNAEHSGCSGCDGDPSRGGDQVNVTKFDFARSVLLDGSPGVERECQLADGSPHSAPMGDWRCGGGDFFYHRVVGWGVDTDSRIHFYKTSRCARREVVTAITGGVIFGGLSPLAYFTCLAREERRDVLAIDGDHTVPLRSTVGILDRFDDRLWGISWPLAEAEDVGGAVYDGDRDGFHLNLPNDRNVHALLRSIAAGLITNVSQRPVAIASGFLPYFRVPRGNPRPAVGTPEFDSLCMIGVCPPLPAMTGSSRLAPASSALSVEDRGAADRLRVTVTGDAAVHVFDADGRHRGAPSPETLDLERLAGVAFDADESESRAVLPLGSEPGYRLEIRHGGALDAGGAPVEVPVSLKIEGVDDQQTLWVDRFDGLPLLASTVIEVWIGDGTSVPELTIDALGEGEPVAIEAVTLDGEALDDVVRPHTELSVENGELKLDTTDEGGSGVDQVLYGFDRGQTAPRLYEGPVALPAGVRHVWAYAVDRAGNVEAPKTWDDPDCAFPVLCLATVSVDFEVVDGVFEPGGQVVLRAGMENLGESAIFAPGLRLVLDAVALRVDEVEFETGECGSLLGTVLCELELLEPGERFTVEVEAEVIGEGPAAYQLEALVAESLTEAATPRISGRLEPGE